MIKVENSSELVRDPRTKAVLLTNTPSVQRAIERNRAERAQFARINALEKNVDAMMGMMSRILEKLDGK